MAQERERDQVPKLEQEPVNIHGLGNNKTEIKRRLQPTAEKDVTSEGAS